MKPSAAEACVLSLFAGYEGLGLALEEVLNVTPRYVADIDPGPCKVLAFRYPHVPNLGDVTKVNWATLTGVRIICGGSPCQDISSAGKQRGMRDGTRSNLWIEMREAIRTLRPELVVWENVNAARTTDAATQLLPDQFDDAIRHHLTVSRETCDVTIRARHQRAADRLMEYRAGRLGVPFPQPALRALGRVLGDLASLGFDAEWVSVPASGVGCAHLRWRVFVVAWPADAPSNPGWVGHRIALTTADPNNATTDRERPREESRQGGRRAADSGPVGLNVPTPVARDVKGHNVRRDKTCLTGALLPTPSVADSVGGHERRGGARGDELLLKGIAKMLPTPTAMDSQSSGGNPDTTGSHGVTLTDATARQPERWGEYAAAIHRAEAAFGPAPSAAEVADMHGYRTSCPCTPTKHHPKRGSRRLSCRFDEWLMGLVPGWVTDVPGVTHAEALKMCGNGVVPAQAAFAIRLCIRRALAEAMAA